MRMLGSTVMTTDLSAGFAGATPPARATVDRAEVLDRFRRIRARTRQLFDLLDERMYYERPIALRNPVVFYEGHLPAFAVNTLIKRGLGQRGVDDRLEVIFARGIDPEDERTAVARGNPAWPDRDAVRAYAAAADARIEEAIRSADLERDDHPLLRGAQALWTILEHEEMHQETLAYMWHQVPYALKRAPEGYRAIDDDALASRSPNVGRVSRSEPAGPRIEIPAGAATLGTDLRSEAFGWDNELPCHRVSVDAFTIDAHNVTNAQFLQFVEAGGYRDPRLWSAEDVAWLKADDVRHPPFWEQESGAWFLRAMFERVPLSAGQGPRTGGPMDWPVYVSWAEAAAYARWRGGRLPTEAEFHRAAYGTPSGEERRLPWGDALGDTLPANFDFRRWDPEAVGRHPSTASAFGVHDLVGNGWEWTATVFAPFRGFAPMPSYPEYSADFFDGQHFVMKGASPVTARALARRGFRNWFRPRYPYVYATFRCAW
jgi:iron(II)-dependent oxidoreductase